MRRLSFGYSRRLVEWKIETPEGTIWLQHEPDGQADGLGQLTVDVLADGDRYAGSRPTWARVFRVRRTGVRVDVEPGKVRR